MRNPTLALLAAIASAIAIAAPAPAATFDVTSEADVPDDAIGDGTCHAELGLPGVCTLRAAVQEANAHAGADTISLSAGQHYTLTRSGQDATASNGDLDITDDTTILFFASGERPVVDAGGLERAFEIHAGNVTMLGFDVTGGDATLAGDATGGGIAIDFDAGIVQLSLLNIYGNRANFGAGVYNDGPSTTVSASNIHDNEYVESSAESSGAAIRNRGTMQLDHSAVFANHGVDGQGAVAVSNHPPNTGSSSLDIVNSTIAQNVGVGIESESEAAGNEASLFVSNATVAGNTAVGLRISGSAGAFTMRNSVVARNGDFDCQVSSSMLLDLDLDHYNADSDGTCALDDGPSNNVGIETLLTPVERHGGLTYASWPLTTSVLIDLGPITGCEDDDQHFLERSVDFDGSGIANCDTGAIEMSDDVIFFDPMERL
ncbi:MAG TPA: right-handed parallel beta-helix repeat-containing protein [Rhodanobacteraceae bacterium]|nr:right-handed parallel beta-helix repeat-containing protein [Rhodanobacteraceae bacterium]